MPAHPHAFVDSSPWFLCCDQKYQFAVFSKEAVQRQFWTKILARGRRRVADVQPKAVCYDLALLINHLCPKAHVWNSPFSSHQKYIFLNFLPIAIDTGLVTFISSLFLFSVSSDLDLHCCSVLYEVGRDFIKYIADNVC